MTACSATDNMLLLIVFVSGALADCLDDSNLFITAPREMEALSGSCLLIPCSFRAEPEQDFDGSRETFGIWIKSDHKIDPNNVVFNSSGTVNTYPMRFTGNLRQKNCTTLFSNLTPTYSNKYYFRIENRPFKATAICDPPQITIKDSPPRPRLEIPADLKEEESVTITCSASTPCPQSPPQLTWTLQQDPHNSIEENTDGTFTTKIQKTVTLSDQHDGYNLTCSARYPVNEGKHVQTAEETNTLSVSYAPKDTSVSVSPSGLVSAGSWVNLTCSSRAKPPVSRFTWFNSKDGAVTVSEGQVYSFNVTGGGAYYCVATNDLGSETSPEIHLTVKEGSSTQWEAILGVILGIIALICLVLCVWHLKSTHPTPQQTQNQTGGVPAVEGPETEEGDISYAEINFSKRRPEPSSESVRDSGQQQDTLYAQVKVSKPANSSPQAAH